MGATTLYHPVSLHVLRGAAEYCGWKLGKIKQTRSDFKHCEAVYEIELVSWPAQLATYGPQIMQKQLQHCFMDDIQVTNVWCSKAGIWRARIEVKVGEREQLELVAADAEQEIRA